MGNFTNLKGKQNHLKLQRWAPEWWMDELTNLVPCWIWSHGPRNPGPLPWLTKIRVAIAVACGAVWLSHMTLSGWLSLTQIIGMKCLNISFSHIISSTWPIFKQLCFKVSVSWRDMGLVVATCSKSLGEIGLSNNRFLFRGKPKENTEIYRAWWIIHHNKWTQHDFNGTMNGHMLSPWLVLEPTPAKNSRFRWFQWFLLATTFTFPSACGATFLQWKLHEGQKSSNNTCFLSSSGIASRV